MTADLEHPRLTLRAALRSVGVGAVATGVDLCVLALFASGLDLGPRVASPIALASGVVCQFFGNKLVAFEDRRGGWGRQAALFLCVEALGLGANAFAFDGLVRVAPGVPYVLTRLAVQSAVYWGVCLPLWSRIFHASGQASGRAAEQAVRA